MILNKEQEEKLAQERSKTPYTSPCTISLLENSASSPCLLSAVDFSYTYPTLYDVSFSRSLSLFVHLRHSKTTPRPQHLTELIQQPHSNHAKHHEPTQQAHAPVNANALKHRGREQYRRERKQASRQAIRCEDRSRVARVDIRDVEENGLRDGIDANNDGAQADGGGNPVR